MENKKNVNIWKTLQKVPAGTMFVPLIIGAIITTICQGFFQFDLWSTLGNPMKDMFSSSGQMLIIGLMLFCPSSGNGVVGFRLCVPPVFRFGADSGALLPSGLGGGQDQCPSEEQEYPDGGGIAALPGGLLFCLFQGPGAD